MPQLLEREKPRRTTHRKKAKKPSFLLSALWLPAGIFFCETVAHLFFFGFSFGKDDFFRTLLSLAIGTVLAAISLLFPEKPRKIITAVVLGAIGLFFSVHFVYNQAIHAFFSWQLLGLAADVTQFWRETLFAILCSLHKIVLAFAPFILFLIFGRRLPDMKRGEKNATIVLSVPISVLLVVTLVLSLVFTPGYVDSLSFMKNDVGTAFKNFGLLPSATVDLTQVIFGAPEEKVEPPPPAEPLPEEKEDEYNILEIDFDALIANESKSSIREMHEYFASAPATKKNEYTGMFKGKNLIFLSLEAFCDKAVDPEFTPTLYKMLNEGFVFENFYAPLWGGSTATGEYANMTGNFYTLASCLEQSANTNQYFSFGNLFSRAGYNTFGFHNHTYTYYGRDRSHPNFGFPNFKGIGNGMVLPTANAWPKSDYEMAEATFSDYTGSEPFMTYYMTVSGHANFNWTGNMMAARHRYDLPAKFDGYSENVKAYLATQLEVELMLKSLVEQLDAAGQLENTVFAACCDHLPYALTDAELAELYGLPARDIRNNYDLYRNGFILWSASMEEPITVKTPCASYDMLPTLANLFDVPYDSRLIAGKDILSDTENIVLINTLGSGGSWNWITAEGTYNTVTGKFTKSADSTLSGAALDDYVALTKKKVSAMRKYTLDILDKDYYSYVFE